MYYHALILFLIFTVNASTELKKPTETNKFMGSNEWQEIKGQKVPSGLDYRINLTTGKKEAKILDKGKPNNLSTNFISEQALKDVGKPNKFQSIAEIKRDLGDLLQPKSDFEILKELFGPYDQGNTTDTILEGLAILGAPD